MDADSRLHDGDALRHAGALLDGNHVPQLSGDETACVVCGQAVQLPSAGEPARHLPDGRVVTEANRWATEHDDSGFSLDSVRDAYVSLGGNQAAPISARRLAEALYPDLSEYCADLQARGIDTVDWITPTVGTLIQFEERHGRLRAEGEGPDTAILEWNVPAIS